MGKQGVAQGRAFTLVELLIVIIIIAVLAAVAIPKFQFSKQKAQDSAIRAQLASYRNAVQRFYDDTGLFPFTLSHVTSTTAPPTGLNNVGSETNLDANKWKGPYMLNAAGAPDDFIHYARTFPNVGKLSCVKSGSAADGSLYSTW
ncbi:MAG TPA: prepilin-type N-terminal cleavage/methylation domain-containing protein [Fimbriimonadaceae bacterium]|nr:prepilin-type N-terminal cleavage/methylation domain-containing protein [Fimbriimonadaceae bacterium]